MEKGSQTKSEILKAAVKMASKEGLEAISIGRIAKLVGMSKSGLFGHFQSKENLQVQILDTVSERFTRKVVIPALKSPRGEPRVRHLHRLWKDWVKGNAEHPGGCLLIAASSEVDDQPGPLKQHLKAKQGQLIDTLKKAAELARQEGHFKKDLDVERFAWKWFSLILGFHHYHRLLHHPRAEEFCEEDFEELIAQSRPRGAK
jgi:AcrR family transcriptional regulator